MAKKLLITTLLFGIFTLMWPDDVVTFTGGSQSGSASSRFVKSFGFTMPQLYDLRPSNLSQFPFLKK
jgi:hypothetical protein